MRAVSSGVSVPWFVGLLIFGPAALLTSGQTADARTIAEIIDRVPTPFSFPVLDEPAAIAVDATGDVYVAGSRSDSLFKVTPAGDVFWVQVFFCCELLEPRGLAAAAGGGVYVTGFRSHNVIRVEGNSITEILGASGDGVHELRGPRGIAVGPNGNVYVAGSGSDNVFEIQPDGTVAEVLDASGDFDLLNAGGGWVSGRYSAFGELSVELDGACLDE